MSRAASGGSPPQVRGKPSGGGADDRTVRITPAGAGKTGLVPLLGGVAGDHPRRCGENIAYIHGGALTEGSPPQVRGKHPRGGRCFCPSRITPAGAGKTFCVGKTHWEHRDHPRRCGENLDGEEVGIDDKGSPPQVRGKLSIGFCPAGKYRITPAGAGKTKRLPPCPAWRQDHPRRCGENYSPHTYSRKSAWSTPAGAGKTCSFLFVECLYKDHPRRCGENYLIALNIVNGNRITPAGAGKTWRMGTAQADLQDHPRRCGENRKTRILSRPRRGSPPQVRGKLVIFLSPLP